MQPGFRTKARFFHEMAQLVRSGVALPRAAGLLGNKGPALQLAIALEAGDSPERAFAAAGFSPGDCAVVEAGASAGRLDQVFAELAAHYERLTAARSKVITSLLYPLLVLHLGAVLLAIPPAIIDSSPTVFVRGVLTALGIFYAVGLVSFAAWGLAVRLYRESPASASLIAWIPGVGRWLLISTGSRFSSLFSLFVRSGGRPLRGLELAGEACGSALLRRAASQTAAQVRSGSPLADSFSGRPGVPEEIERAIQVGDHSGRLDEESLRAAKALDQKAANQLDALAEWLPRLIYLTITLYIGWRIIGTALQVAGAIGNALDFE